MNGDPLLVFGPFAFCCVGMLAFVFVVGFFFVRRFRYDRSAAGQQSMANDAEQWLVQQVALLVPWQPGSLADISDFSNYTWTRVISEKTRGTVKSVSSDRSIIAFYNVWSFTNRRLWARTTAHHWYMTLGGGEVRMTLNGAPFGSWRTSDGALLDPAGQPIGYAKRPSTWTLNRMPTNWEDRWFEVVLRDQVIGAILAQRGMRKTGLGLAPKMAAVAPAATPTAESERWLLALAVVELGWMNIHATRVTTSSV